ncbi:MAG: peptide deformylase [Bacteroidales bacterium]|nr:peptide deformylase [Bacteroidales bacterium]MBP5682226.1 peptide deformylase [Bacteroidales bacterium]
MILPISIIGTSVLRKKAEAVTKDYPDLQKLIEDMFETMYKTEGVGLAAPQVGHSIRLFVCDAAAMTDDDNDTFTKSFKRAMLNPEIIESFGSNVSFNEGCLSIPGLHENVVRPDGVKIRYFDENFVEHEETLTGNCARVVQHEYDHLDGVLFTDKVGMLRRKLIRNKLANISKGKFEHNYKVKMA